MTFDPNAAAAPGSGIFGLSTPPEETGIVLLPVPFDATTSYGGGAGGGPEAILKASAQVDLYDHQFGRVYEAGIAMAEPSQRLAELSRVCRALAAPIIEKGGADAGDAGSVHLIDEAGEEINAHVYERTRRVLESGKVPGLVGGDHSTPFGAIKACAEAGELGILHLDAHLDLRPAFEGFAWSHASIMHNVLRDVPGVTRLVSVGIRDFGENELELARGMGSRARIFFDQDMADAIAGGTPFRDIAREIIESLPGRVYVSFDIDGLDPSLCPHTGTPVPGGLSFAGMAMILKLLRDSGRVVAGFDLVEVSPGPDGSEWDGNVGARALYKLCGAARPR